MQGRNGRGFTEWRARAVGRRGAVESAQTGGPQGRKGAGAGARRAECVLFCSCGWVRGTARACGREDERSW